MSTPSDESAWRSKRSLLLFLLGVFLVSCLLQGIRWRELGMIDSGMWGNEALYVLNNDTSEEFNFLGAYGHPGGTVIEGAIAIHAISKLPYDKSVLLFVTLFDSLAIAAACALAYSLRRNNPWWIAVLAVLSLNWLYEYATPPSATAAVLVSLLCLITLYIYEHKEHIELFYLGLWGLISGITVATRADIGIFSSLLFMILILPIIKLKRAALLIGEAILAFIIFDPFMWFMPVQHIKDLIHKAVFHYAYFSEPPLNWVTVMTFSFITLISIFLALTLVLLRKKIKPPLTSRPPLPPIFVGMLLCMTSALYVIFLTSHYQAIRYFMPITFIWEMFLPLLLFSMIDDIQFSFARSAHRQLQARKIFRWAVIGIFFFYNSFFLVQALLVASSYNILPT